MVLKESQYLDEEGFPCLRGEAYWRWRALTAENDYATLAYQKSRENLAAWIAAHPEYHELRGQVSARKEAAAKATVALLAFQREIEAMTNLDLSKCAIDDQTGRITVLEDSENNNGTT